MENDKKPDISHLMKPQLREAYDAALKIFTENDFSPEMTIKFAPNKMVHTIQFTNLPNKLVGLAADAIRGKISSFAYSIPPPGSPPDSGFLTLQ